MRWPSPEVCPVYGAPPLASRARGVFVRLSPRGGDGRARLFETDTADFSDEELLRVKDEHGQLYADVSRKLAPDDFAADLAKLQELPMCLRCPARASCPGAYTVVRSDVFTRDDQRVAEVLSGLRGDVLDVGCGDAPYLHRLGPLMASEAIRYVGLDPDPGRLRVLASRYPSARFVTLTAERAPELGRRFDHVLILRSFNHLADPARAVAALLGALRPGGTLTVVDNVAFGLVRLAVHARRAESSQAEHEHYQNADLTEAWELLKGLPLRVLEAHEVSPRSSNQWLLRMEHLGAR
ncbi:MAG: class I SAM-dependent methyltransferase [Polyangiaceae bacterium]|nr:class I SAM-dependent methyltransferase [Polyangiaceae bacterium]